MRETTAWDDDEDGFDGEDWDSSGEDGLEDDDEATIPCPGCGEEIYDDAVRCPHCGSYVVDDSHAMSSRPTWVILTALVCLAMALGWVLAW
jgi:hypothetical protein